MNRRDLGARLIVGAAAGSAGAATLNIMTYLDMLLRGRAASSVPKQDVQQLEDVASIPRAGDQAAGGKHSNRESAAGALIGYVVGLGIGSLTGALWPRVRSLPLALTGAVVGAAAMAGSDVPSIALGTTDPRSWGRTGWLADMVPHLAYGLVTVALTGALLSEDG